MADVKKASLDLLAADPENPRAIGDDSFVGLGASLQAFGDISGIVFNKKTGRLVAGHQRVRALREAGAKNWMRSAEGGWIEHPETKERFPVRIVEWDEQTERAANLSANNPAIQGEFTAAALAQLEQLRVGLDGSTDFTDLKLGDLEELLSDLRVATQAAASDPQHVEFTAYNDGATHQCPKCGFSWNGKPSGGGN